MRDGGDVLNGLVFQSLCFLQCEAFVDYITSCLKLKVEETVHNLSTMGSRK